MLLIDEHDRVLLFHGRDPAAGSYWFSVGGGVENGEDARAAACRELFEETGVQALPADLGEPVYVEQVEITFKGQHIRQHQTYFALRVSGVTVDIKAIVEAESIDRHDWWSLSELEAADEVYYPLALVSVLRKVLRPFR